MDKIKVIRHKIIKASVFIHSFKHNQQVVNLSPTPSHESLLPSKDHCEGVKSPFSLTCLAVGYFCDLIFCVMCTHTTASVWRSEGELKELVLSGHHGSPGQTQVTGIWQQVPSLFDPFLPALVFVFFFFFFNFNTGPYYSPH